MTNLDETGLEVAGCRHALALKALNMFVERCKLVCSIANMTLHYRFGSFSFGYPHYLHTKSFPETKCVWADGLKYFDQVELGK